MWCYTSNFLFVSFPWRLQSWLAHSFISHTRAFANVTDDIIADRPGLNVGTIDWRWIKLNRTITCLIGWLSSLWSHVHRTSWTAHSVPSASLWRARSNQDLRRAQDPWHQRHFKCKVSEDKKEKKACTHTNIRGSKKTERLLKCFTKSWDALMTQPGEVVVSRGALPNYFGQLCGKGGASAVHTC